jgi:hypothetical protein
MDLRDITWGDINWINRAEDSCGHSNEPSSSVKRWEISEWLSDWRFLNKDSTL